MSKNKVALGIAAAVVGLTGVAGASVAVHTTSGDDGHHADVAADAAGVSLASTVGALADLPSLPAIPDVGGVVDTVTGIAGGDALGTVTGAVANAQEIVGGALSTATGVLPAGLGNPASLLSTCAASAVPLPAAIPLPANTIANGLAQLGQIEALTNMISGLTANLPIKVPTLLSASDVFNAVKGQINCAGALSAQSSPLPAICDIQAGLPVAIPAPVAGALRDVMNMTGQTVNMSGNAGIGANCQSSAVTGAVSSVASNPTNVLSTVQATVNKVAPALNLPKVDLPALPAIPGVGGALPALPAVPDVVGTVQGLVGNLPVGLPNVLDLNGILSGILPSSCTAGASGGLLGSLTAVLSASCS